MLNVYNDYTAELIVYYLWYNNGLSQCATWSGGGLFHDNHIVTQTLADCTR